MTKSRAASRAKAGQPAATVPTAIGAGVPAPASGTQGLGAQGGLALTPAVAEPVNQMTMPVMPALTSSQPVPRAPASVAGRAADDVRAVAHDPAALGFGVTALGIAAVGLAAAAQLVVRARRS